MIGVVLLVFGVLSTSTAQRCDVLGIQYSSLMERDGFALTPLSEQQKKAETSIDCDVGLDRVYLPPDSDSIVQLSLLKCERNPSPPPSWQYHLKYNAENVSVVEEWRTGKIKAACRRKVCSACADWSFPCEGVDCVKPKSEVDANECEVHVCPGDKMRVNSQEATIGRPYCKRTGDAKFEWYFNGEAVQTATCVSNLNCSTVVSPIQCDSTNCDDFLTTDAWDIKCKEDGELRVTSAGAEVSAEGVYCSENRWMWMNSTRVPADLPSDAELRCAAPPTIPATGSISAILLAACISFACLIFSIFAWIHFRMNSNRLATDCKGKMNTPALPSANPGMRANVKRRKDHSSHRREKLTPEQEAKEAEEHAKAMAATVEHLKKRFPQLAMSSKRKPQKLSTTEKRQKPSTTTKTSMTMTSMTETNKNSRKRDSRDSRGDRRRRSSKKRDARTTKKSRGRYDDDSESESSRDDDSLDERSARDGYESERSRKRRRRNNKRRTSPKPKRSQKKRKVKPRRRDEQGPRRDKTLKVDPTQDSEFTEKTQVEEEKTVREKEKEL